MFLSLYPRSQGKVIQMFYCTTVELHIYTKILSSKYFLFFNLFYQLPRESVPSEYVDYASFEILFLFFLHQPFSSLAIWLLAVFKLTFEVNKIECLLCNQNQRIEGRIHKSHLCLVKVILFSTHQTCFWHPHGIFRFPVHYEHKGKIYSSFL